MKRDLQGRYIVSSTLSEEVQAFVPASLPPKPEIEWTAKLREAFAQAHLALGRLDSVASFLPNRDLLLYTYVRKEAVLSSMIEGTMSSLSDLLMHELDHKVNVPVDDVQEVSNYVAALNHGLQRLEEGLPISVRLIKEVHAILLSRGRGSQKQPGEFRQSQNWIGGGRPGTASFVPPPPEKVDACIAELEKFINDVPEKTPALLKAALVHLQFETIHPFLDGNGRVGRLLISLVLSREGILKQPLLYLSLYFKSHRQEYYAQLDSVRKQGDWEEWLLFFATAVSETATDAIDSTQRILSLMETDAARLRQQGAITGSLLKLHAVLLQHPITSAKQAQDLSGLAMATVNTCLTKLEALEIVKEVTGKRRSRLYVYTRYLDILNEGNELPS